MMRRSTPGMIVGAVAAAFLSQAGSGVPATLHVDSVATLAAPTLFCASNTVEGSPNGNEYFVCSVSDDGAQAQGYWDGTLPPDGPVTENEVRATTDGNARLTVSGGSHGSAFADSGAIIDVRASGLSSAQAIGESGSTGIGEAVGGSQLQMASILSSIVRAVVNQGSSLNAYGEGGSTVDAYVTDSSEAFVVADGGSDLTAYVIDHSGVSASAEDGSFVELAAGRYSALSAYVLGSRLSALATDESTIQAYAEDGSDVIIKADGRSFVGAQSIDSTIIVRAANEALVLAGALDEAFAYVDASDGSEVTLVTQNGAYGEATAAAGSVMHLDARGAGGVKAAGVYGALLQAESSDSTIESVSIGGYNNALAENGSSVWTRSSGYGAEAYSEAFDGAQLVTFAQSTDPEDTARVVASVFGNVLVNAEANDEGSRTSVEAYSAQETVGAQAEVRALAYDGAEVSVSAKYGAGDSVVAAAAGEGSRAYVILDHTTGNGPTTITVLATQGGTAYIFTDSGEFGCYGGVTSVRSEFGSCDSNGSVTVITYADGTTETLTDPVVPQMLKAPLDVEVPLPPIERMLVNPEPYNPSTSSAGRVEGARTVGGESPVVEITGQSSSAAVELESRTTETSEVSDSAGPIEDELAASEGSGVDAGNETSESAESDPTGEASDSTQSETADETADEIDVEPSDEDTTEAEASETSTASAEQE